MLVCDSRTKIRHHLQSTAGAGSHKTDVRSHTEGVS